MLFEIYLFNYKNCLTGKLVHLFLIALIIYKLITLILFEFRKSNKKFPNKAFIEVSGVRFDVVFKYLGSLAIALVNIEEALSNQAILRKDFISFKRMMELVNAKPSEFNVSSNDQNKMKLLYALTIQIEKEIIDSHSFFRRLLDAIINSNNNLASNIVLAEQLASYIKDTISLFESESFRFKDNLKWLAMNTLFLIYVWCFRKDDRRLLKLIYECQKKTNCHYIHLKGNVGLYSEKFLSKHLLKSMVDKKMNDVLQQQRENLIKSSLGSKVKQLKNKVNIWLIQFDGLMKNVQDPGQNIIDLLHKQMKSVEDGLELSLQCHTIVRNHIFHYLSNCQAMLKSDLIAICKLVIIAKAIELLFNRKKATILFVASRYTQYYSYILLNALNLIKKRLLSEVKKYSEKKLDVLSAIILASNCIHGPIMTKERQILTSLCFSLVEPSLNEIESEKVYSGYKKIQSCSLIFKRLYKWTNCEFIYFHRALMGIYFNHCVESELENIFEFRYFFHSFSDCLPFIENGLSYDTERKEKLITELEQEIYELFKTNYIDKVCSHLETELRLQVHSHLQLDDQSPFKRYMDNFSIAANCRSLKLLNRLIPLKEMIENYLNEITYNLTTIALHDWKTYESMLNLARSNYNFDFVTSQLPTQTIEQGLDVLEITRNIHIFVARYRYNLNNQMFIEQSSENKHLNVLLIRHVANSIQTHGFGVINTAVNFTYQFLKRKFHIFSQFLYEDPIKSRLIKDLKYFRESKLTKYPFERAENHVRAIRKLGISSSGQSYLDRFQQLITEIGNALGFVRMLRSGALHCSSNSVNYVPDLDDLSKISFKTMVAEEGLGEECLKSAENLDTILSTLNQNFSEATNYFELLVQVFQKTFREKDFYHLKNFYVILPALTINYVEHSIESKEKISRKNKMGAMLTDEGLPMGLAYILKLLDQFVDFDSFQWFSSVKDKIQAEVEKARSQSGLNANNGESNLAQTISLTEKRLETLEKEFNLLNYNLTSCRILFRATQNLE